MGCDGETREQSECEQELGKLDHHDCFEFNVRLERTRKLDVLLQESSPSTYRVILNLIMGHG